jgi:hypothetical protein
VKAGRLYAGRKASSRHLWPYLYIGKRHILPFCKQPFRELIVDDHLFRDTGVYWKVAVDPASLEVWQP